MNTDRAAFNAILWKEFRENFKWAVLGLIFVGSSLTGVLLRLIDRSAYGGDLNWPDLSLSLFGMTSVLPAVVGLTIGLAQVLFENRGDAWGFLTHRPVRRSTLFWGKAVAGILLYMTAVGVPLACGILWIATPGHLPMPFDVHFVLPVIADVLCGLVYYFAGLMTGMRDARWYASRVMGVGIGIVCSIALSYVPEFWQAISCCVLGISISTASAWGAFVEGGRYSSQPRLARFATGVSISAGLLIVGAIVFGVGASFVPALVSNSSFTRYQITGDGIIVRLAYEDGAIQDVMDLQGRSIERYRDRDARGAMNRGVVSSPPINPTVRLRWNGDYRHTSELFRPFESSDALSDGRTFTWYYISRLGRIAAYDNQSAKLVGWLGPGGFTGGGDMPADRFEQPLAGTIESHPTLISFESAVYRLDLSHRHIEKIFTADSGESVIGAYDSNTGGSSISEFGDKARFVAISTTRRVIIQTPGAVTPLSAPRDSNSSKFGSVIVYKLLRTREPRTIIWYTDGSGMSGFITEYGTSSTPIAQYTLPSLFTEYTLTWGYALIRSVRENLAMRTLLWKRSIFHFSSIGSSPGQRLASWLIPLFEGALFGALAFARGRRYAFSSARLSLWTAIGFALGPGGYVLMLALLEWPAFEKCPECGRPRLVTRDSCEHCSKPFTLPLSDGTEVFESLS